MVYNPESDNYSGILNLTKPAEEFDGGIVSIEEVEKILTDQLWDEMSSNGYSFQYVNVHGDAFANGGRLKSALMRDRKYTSDEEWEKRYIRKTPEKHYKHEMKEGGTVIGDGKYYIDFRHADNSYNHKAGKAYFDKLPNKTYFAAGYQDKDQRGNAYYFCWDGGTCLIPIHNSDGTIVNIPKNAGKQIVDGELSLAKGGRLKSALMRDRKYTSHEEWEKRYLRKGPEKHYKGYKEGGLIDHYDESDTVQDIWRKWSFAQRQHFIMDHLKDKVSYEQAMILSKTKPGDLPEYLKRQVSLHMRGVRYEAGGPIPEYFGKGYNFEIIFFRTSNFDISKEYSNQFIKAVETLDEIENPKIFHANQQYLMKLAEAIDDIFYYEKEIIIIGSSNLNNFRQLVNLIGIAGYYHWKLEARIRPLIDLKYLGDHLYEIMKYTPENIERTKLKYGGQLAEGGELALPKLDAPATVPNSLVVCLYGVGNPDFDQYEDLTEKTYVPVKSIREAQAVCRKFIDDNDLGGGNWAGGQVYDVDGNVVAYISYNGRMWKSDNLTMNNEEISFEGAEKNYYSGEKKPIHNADRAFKIGDKVRLKQKDFPATFAAYEKLMKAYTPTDIKVDARPAYNRIRKQAGKIGEVKFVQSNKDMLLVKFPKEKISAAIPFTMVEKADNFAKGGSVNKKPWLKDMFTIDGEHYWQGYYQKDELSHGWYLPVFTKEIAQDIAKYFNEAFKKDGTGQDLKFKGNILLHKKIVDTKGDKKYIYETEKHLPEKISFEGKPVTAYNIGDDWIWDLKSNIIKD